MSCETENFNGFLISGFHCQVQSKSSSSEVLVLEDKM